MAKKTVTAKEVVAKAIADLTAEAQKLKKATPAPVKGAPTPVKGAPPKLKDTPPVLNKDLQVRFAEKEALKSLWENKSLKIGPDTVKGGKLETSNDLTFVLPVTLPSGLVLRYKITFEPPAKADKATAPPPMKAAEPVKRGEPVKGASGSFGLSQRDEIKMRADWQALSPAQKARTTPQEFAREWARRHR